ncbi:MAG: prephenate dehydratase [Proteobacteria bacterium]|nr:prephenate dehydratase [Pseudomonadota bacterium]
MKLNEIRKRIDTIDRELLQLIEARMEYALRSTRFKETVSDTDREKDVLAHIERQSRDLLAPEFTSQVHKMIIAESVRLQGEMRDLVAFQGEHGAYGDVASRRLVSSGAYVPCLEFSDVFQGVEQGFFDFGVVPVENSLEGAVTQVNDLLTTTKLKVIGETVMPIHHCLLASEETDYREIRVVYSHPQALAQCRGFLERNNLEPRPYYDTAGAAKMISREHPKAAAAIASSLSADLYELQTIKEGIEDNASNSTRFLLLSKEEYAETGNKCSIVFATTHEAGKLYEVLKLFAQSNINLTRIASMPTRTDPGNSTFFLDFEGSVGDEKVDEVLAKMTEGTNSLRFLGCYPKDTA